MPKLYPLRLPHTATLPHLCAAALPFVLAFAPPAQAGFHPDALTTDGTQCRAYGKVTSLDLYAINVGPQGVHNADTVARKVICPVPRYADGPSVTVYVDGFVNAGYQLDCTLYSHDFNGMFKGSAWFRRDGNVTPGTFDAELTIPQATSYSYQSVVCSLPPGGQGGIYGVIAMR
jgi:hypothetical protein